MGDLTEYARGVAAGLTARWFSRREAKKLAAEKLIEFAQDLERQAHDMLELSSRLSSQLDQNDNLHIKLRKARDITARIDIAIEEMPGNGPKPAAIILSPSQYRERDFGRRKEYRGIPLLIATGLSGPIVATRDGLDALTRQAPELTIRTA